MIYKVQVNLKSAFRDKHGEHVSHDISEIGLRCSAKAKYHPVFRLEGELEQNEVKEIASKLLIDPVIENYTLESKKAPKTVEIEVWLKKGVTDTVSESVVKAVKDLGIQKTVKVKTGHKFVLSGVISKATADQIAKRLLANPMVQEYTIE